MRSGKITPFFFPFELPFFGHVPGDSDPSAGPSSSFDRAGAWHGRGPCGPCGPGHRIAAAAAALRKRVNGNAG